jgi:hypothetical protein
MNIVGIKFLFFSFACKFKHYFPFRKIFSGKSPAKAVLQPPSFLGVARSGHSSSLPLSMLQGEGDGEKWGLFTIKRALMRFF